LKVLIVARPFAFHGGVERATAGLIAAIRDRGHDIHLLSPPGQKEVPGVVLHRLTLPPLPPLGRVLALVAGTAVMARRRGWDVVQSHERTLSQDVYRAGEGCHQAYLATRGRAGRGLYHRVVLTLERLMFARTPSVVAISRTGAAEIAGLYAVPPQRLSTIYNGVDLERFHPRNRARHRGGARAEAGIPDGAWLLAFVGSGFERKGLATAIEALATVDDASTRLVVVGKGETAAYAQAAGRLGVAGRIAWLGPREDVERWYAAADAVVLPTLYEPFGNVHLEALASGVPVVTTTRAGGSELIEPGRNGAVVSPGSAPALARALDEVRSTAGEAQRAHARRSAEPFTYVRQVTEFEGVWRKGKSADLA
jgi:UDP-glucose:(heptosyl)LPS alpha-1,3-glucosyltransferase